MKPRIASVDIRRRESLLNISLGSVDRVLSLMQKEPGRLEQTRWRSLSTDFIRICECQYAIGYPIDEVRQSANQAVDAWDAVVSRRAAARSLEQTGSDPRDWSAGNSCENYDMMCLALAANNHKKALSLAPLSWDPDNASYISPNSEFAITALQQLSFCLKDILLGETDPLAALSGFTPKKRKSPLDRSNLVTHAAMLQGIVEGNASAFLAALDQQIAWQEEFASDPENHFYRWTLLPVHALGLSSLALAKGLVSRDEIKQDTEAFQPSLFLTN